MVVATKNKSTKYLELRNALRQYIRTHPAGTCLPSYAEMFKLYGTRQATIDQALREFDEEKLIVREHGRGIFITPRAAQRNIAIIFGRNVFDVESSPINQFMLQYAEKQAKIFEKNANFFINVPQVSVESYPIQVCRNLMDTLNSQRLEGMLLIATRGPHEIEWLASFGIPLVVMTSCPGPACGVCIDDAAVVRRGVDALVCQGCRRIALLTLSGSKRKQNYRDDLSAYSESLAGHGLSADPTWIWDHAPSHPEESSGLLCSNELIGYRAGIDMLGQGAPLPFDGLLCNDDMAMRGFLSRMHELGLKPGIDMQIAVQTNRSLPVLLGAQQAVIQLEINPETLVDQAFSLLDGLMSGEKITAGYTLKVNECIQEIIPKQYQNGVSK